jgi:hypothetical protein
MYDLFKGWMNITVQRQLKDNNVKCELKRLGENT